MRMMVDVMMREWFLSAPLIAATGFWGLASQSGGMVDGDIFFSGSERIIKSLNSTVSILYMPIMPSASVNLGLVRPKVLMERLMSLILIPKLSPEKAVFAGFSVLLAACLFPLFLRAYLCNTLVLQTVNLKDVSVCDLLVELLESIESFLKHLDIYTKITPTVAMTEIVVKTLMELVSIIALATQLIKQRQLGEFLLVNLNGLPDSIQPREIYKEAFWWEVRWDGAGKARSTLPGRGSNDCSAGSRDRLWSCPEYEGGHGWWANWTWFTIRRLTIFLPSRWRGFIRLCPRCTGCVY